MSADRRAQGLVDNAFGPAGKSRCQERGKRKLALPYTLYVEAPWWLLQKVALFAWYGIVGRSLRLVEQLERK
jgi:hypothetical protein